MQDDTKQAQEVKAKRTAKNSVFLDLFQDKKNLLKLYKTLHPEDIDTTDDTLDIVAIDNVLTYLLSVLYFPVFATVYGL